MIQWNKTKRLAVVRRARKILSDKDRWTKQRLRVKRRNVEPRYCVLGAIEQATYELGYAEPTGRAFREDESRPNSGYMLGRQMSLSEFSKRKYGMLPFSVNDTLGWEAVLELLDDYESYLKETPAAELAKQKGDRDAS